MIYHYYLFRAHFNICTGSSVIGSDLHWLWKPNPLVYLIQIYCTINMASLEVIHAWVNQIDTLSIHLKINPNVQINTGRSLNQSDSSISIFQFGLPLLWNLLKHIDSELQWQVLLQINEVNNGSELRRKLTTMSWCHGLGELICFLVESNVLKRQRISKHFKHMPWDIYCRTFYMF